MSRQDPNLLDTDGTVITGYDYSLQAWVKDYIIMPCGHPDGMKAHGCCFAGKNHGKDIRTFQERDKR